MGDDWNPNLFDDYNPEDQEPDNEVQCKYCKERYLHWKQFRGRPRLFNEDEGLHVCPKPSAGEDFK